VTKIAFRSSALVRFIRTVRRAPLHSVVSAFHARAILTKSAISSPALKDSYFPIEPLFESLIVSLKKGGVIVSFCRFGFQIEVGIVL